MNRLGATLLRDATLLWRYQLVAVSVVVVAALAIVISVIPSDLVPPADVLAPLFLAGNLMITTFYFMAAFVLLEKGEGSLTATVTTPLTAGEYLLAKGLALTMLALVESLALVALLFGNQGNWLLLVAGVMIMGMIYALAGFIMVARYDSINEFLIPSIGMAIIMLLPLWPHSDTTLRWLFLLHPVEPPLLMLRSAYGHPVVGELAAGIFGSGIWLMILFTQARGRLRHWASKTVGS